MVGRVIVNPTLGLLSPCEVVPLVLFLVSDELQVPKADGFTPGELDAGQVVGVGDDGGFQ
jgi:hypothetical protein